MSTVFIVLFRDDDNTDHTVSVQLDDVESTVQFIDDHNPDIEFAANCRNVRDSIGQVDAYVVVYSVTDRASFAYAQNCLQEMKRNGTLNDGVSVLLVANKQDLVRNRIVSEGDGKRLSSKRHCKFIEVSALLDHRVDEVLVSTIREIRQRSTESKFGVGRHLSDDDRVHLMGCLHRATVAFCRKLFK